MLKHQFSDFSYAVNTDSAKKGYKEILVCYIYNGVEVLRKVYIPEGPGISYIFEARKIIDKEIKDGTLSSYSYRFIRRNKKRRIKPRKIVAAINEGKSLAAAEGFTGFTYAVKPSTNLRKKFVEVSYNYNGEKVIRTLKLRGKATDDYVAKAKDKIKDEIESGFLEKYSEKYLKEKALLNSTPTRTPVVRVTNGGNKLLIGVCAVVAVGLVLGAIFTTKAILEGKSSNYYEVNFAPGTGCNYVGETKVAKGAEEYACTVTAIKDVDSPIINSITMGDDVLVAGVDYTFNPVVVGEENNLKITKKIDGDININGAVELTTFTVNLVPIGGVEFIDAPTTSKKGEKYNCQVECTAANDALDIKSVTMGGRALQQGTASSGDYYYHEEEKKLIFNVPTDGIITITIGTKATQYKVNYHLSDGCILDEGPNVVGVEEPMKCTFKDPSPNKILITDVSMGGDILATPTDWYFNEDTRELLITKGATGNVLISARSYNPGSDTFTVTVTEGEGCVHVEPIEGINPGDPCTVTLAVEDTTNKKVRITAVVMGGVSLKEESGYRFKPETGELTITRVTDNVSINFEAVDIGEVTATPVYEPSEDGTHYVVKTFTLPAGKTASDIESITIDPEHAPANSNAETLPVTEIEKGALNEFTKLQELSIPFIGAKYLAPGEQTPMDGTQLFGHIFGDTPHAGSSATWQYYYDDEGVQHPRKFIIPNTLRYVTITGSNTVVPAGAFSGCRSIYSINFEDNTVSTIQNSAFQNCESLREIIIPSNVTMIQDCAFQNCTGLQHLDLPLGLTTIGRYAFDGCTGFSRIYLNNSITIVGEAAFSNVRYGVIACSKTKTQVENIDTWNKNWVDATTTVIYGAIGTQDYISKDNNFHYMLVKNDDGDTGAFVAEYLGYTAADAITIPYSVDDKDTTEVESYPIFGLGNNMFSEFTVTTKFTFQCTELTSIGSYCFAYCYALNNLEGFSNLTELKEIGGYAFGACTSLTSISVPTSVSSIGEYAFAYNKITEFDLSGCTNLKSLDTGVFYYCYETTSITLPTGLTYLGENIFEGCYKLTSLELNTSGIDTIPYALMYCANDLEHPERVSQLTSFTWISETPLKTIGGSAFGGCSKLGSFVVSDGTTSTTNTIPNTVTKFGDYAFVRCTSITQLYMPAANPVQVIEMGLEVFKGWTGSQTLRISTSLVSGEGIAGTEATTNWGWNLSRSIGFDWYHYTASASGSDKLVIYVNG